MSWSIQTAARQKTRTGKLKWQNIAYLLDHGIPGRAGIPYDTYDTGRSAGNLKIRRSFNYPEATQ